MARGINKVIIVGNLGVDPETRYMPSGSAVTNLRVATSESWKDKNTGEQQERTEWHRVAMFGRLAEIAAEYLRKGHKVYVEGRLQTRQWEDQSGNKRYTTELIANRVQSLERRDREGREGRSTENEEGDRDGDAVYMTMEALEGETVTTLGWASSCALRDSRCKACSACGWRLKSSLRIFTAT